MPSNYNDDPSTPFEKTFALLTAIEKLRDIRAKARSEVWQALIEEVTGEHLEVATPDDIQMRFAQAGARLGLANAWDELDAIKATLPVFAQDRINQMSLKSEEIEDAQLRASYKVIAAKIKKLKEEDELGES